jgi:hypothetical protein
MDYRMLTIVVEHRLFVERIVVDSLVVDVHKVDLDLERFASADDTHLYQVQYEEVEEAGFQVYHPLEVADTVLDLWVWIAVDRIDPANHEIPCDDRGRSVHETSHVDTIHYGHDCYLYDDSQAQDRDLGENGRLFCDRRIELAHDSHVAVEKTVEAETG